ncbi:MAG: hypothetical protein IJE29_05425, partial [Firmicutes bacterium]|nr:hypothetical protein [Bacillota bacterium]
VRLLEDPLSESLLAQRFVAGDVIRCYAEDGELKFTKADENSTEMPAETSIEQPAGQENADPVPNENVTENIAENISDDNAE